MKRLGWQSTPRDSHAPTCRCTAWRTATPAHRHAPHRRPLKLQPTAAKQHLHHLRSRTIPRSTADGHEKLWWSDGDRGKESDGQDEGAQTERPGHESAQPDSDAGQPSLEEDQADLLEEEAQTDVEQLQEEEGEEPDLYVSIFDAHRAVCLLCPRTAAPHWRPD